jgi:hypothetical protein
VGGRRHAELAAYRASRAERDLAMPRDRRAIAMRAGPDLVASALPHLLAAVSSEVPNQIDPTDHAEKGAKFVIIDLEGS